ncbi:hypothetical protein OAP56_00705 [Rickettsiaceae bacterium]|nr:hypothetical protein [Rickettsiaceae bacterium]
MYTLLDENFVIALCFAIFLYFAYKPIRKAIIASLDMRIADIKRKFSETEKLKQDAKILLENIQGEMNGFEDRKKKMLSNAKESTEELLQEKIKKMDLVFDRKKEQAIKSIDTHKSKVAQSIQVELSESVEKLVRTYFSETKNNSISDKEIFEHFLKK